MTGGTLNITNLLYIGGYRSPYSNIVNVAGGSLVVGTLRIGDYYDSKKNGKWDVLNISGNGVVSNTIGEVQTSVRSSGSRSRIDISGNGTFVTLKDAKLGTTAAGKSVVSLSDNATMNVSGKNLYLTYGSGAYAELTMDGSSSLIGVYDMSIGYETSSTGKVVVAGTEFKKISVAEGASLDLNGAEVTVEEYRVSGVRQPAGTYSAHNGTIHVTTSAPAGRMAIIR